MKSKFYIILIVIFILLLAVFLINIQQFQREETKSAIITMIAKQWRFEIVNVTGILKYEYTPIGETKANLEIYVSKNTLIIMRIKSIDIVHGIGIEGYPVNSVLPPNEEVEVKFLANIVGKFKFYCTVFCGTGHPDHIGYLIVV